MLELVVRIAILFGVVFGIAYGATRAVRVSQARRLARKRAEGLDRLRALDEARERGEIDEEEHRELTGRIRDLYRDSGVDLEE